MMRTRVKVILVSLLVGSLISSCSTIAEKFADTTGEGGEKTVVNESSTTKSDGGDGQTSTSGFSGGVKFARNAIGDLASPLNQKIIYFDYEKSNVLAEYISVLIITPGISRITLMSRCAWKAILMSAVPGNLILHWVSIAPWPYGVCCYCKVARLSKSIR